MGRLALTALLLGLLYAAAWPAGINISGTVTGDVTLGSRVTTQFDKTNDASLANITGLSATLVAGKSYYFSACLHVAPDTTGGHKYAMGGTATATAVVYQINSLNNSTNLNILNSRQTAMAGAAGVVAGTADYTEIVGLIIVNAAGTLAPQFAQQTATPATTSSVLVGSTFVVEQIP